MSNDKAERFGGPSSSHQDREHPGKNGQPTGHKGAHAEASPDPAPGESTSDRDSHVSGGGGERDAKHARDK